MIFNHFMFRVEDDSSTIELDQFDFPLSINASTADELSVEEVRCREYTVGAAYNYYSNGVVQNLLTETMISVVFGDYKSTCFGMSCYILEMRPRTVHSGSLRLESKADKYAQVLALDSRASSPLLEEMCIQGIDPIVSSVGIHSLEVKGGDGELHEVNACTSGFRWFGDGSLNVHGKCGDSAYKVVGSRDKVRAVRTALATVSIVLTPKSLFGGKNPSTKLVSYFVHNVNIQ